MLTIILLATAQTAAGDAQWEKLKARIEVAPQEVATFIERRTGCNHFYGEAGSDFDERERWVQAQLKKLRCEKTDADGKALHEQHRTNAEVVQLLRDTEDLPPW